MRCSTRTRRRSSGDWPSSPVDSRLMPRRCWRHRPAAHRQALHAAGVELANRGEIAAACGSWQQCIAIGRTIPADDLGTHGTALVRLSSYLADQAAATDLLAEAAAFFAATGNRHG